MQTPVISSPKNVIQAGITISKIIKIVLFPFKCTIMQHHHFEHVKRKETEVKRI